MLDKGENEARIKNTIFSLLSDLRESFLKDIGDFEKKQQSNVAMQLEV